MHISYRTKKRLRREACVALVACWLALWLGAVPAVGQITLLSRGDSAGQWRAKQLESVELQLADSELTQALRHELEAQLAWLNRWQPGKLTAQPLWDAAEGPAEADAWTEPVLDPEGTAGALREKLLGEKAKPTAADTQRLKKLLTEFPTDLGLRQLHLHWIDQPQYRKEYAESIADVALMLVRLLEQQATSPDMERALAFALYRRGRGLAYRELPEVVEERPLEDPEKHTAQLIGAYRQLKEHTEQVRPEFVLLDVRMLRRDNWNGRALQLLEQFGGRIELKWFLKKRRDILHDLGWESPAKEAASIYAKAFPDES